MKSQEQIICHKCKSVIGWQYIKNSYPDTSRIISASKKGTITKVKYFKQDSIDRFDSERGLKVLTQITCNCGKRKTVQNWVIVHSQSNMDC